MNRAERRRQRRAPLWATPSHGPPRALVVWYSGDGGWGRADQTIIPILAAHGLAVVDLNGDGFPDLYVLNMQGDDQLL